MLADKGANVETADSGEKAISLLEKSIENKNPFQIILMDNFMPEKSGLQTAREIRNNYQLKDLQLIITSSSFGSRYIKNEKDYIDNYIMKPIRKKELFELLTEAAAKIAKNENKIKKHKKNLKSEKKETQNKQKNKAENKNELNEKKILVVEDNSDNRLLIDIYLKKKNYNVEMAVNGLEGFKKIKNNNYDLILMDIQMPELDGYQAVKKIRNWEKTENKVKNTILALTAFALESDKERALRKGFDGYLTKPIKKNKLYKTIEKYL